MAPAKGRFAERLLAAADMPREELIELAARACHALPDARRYADARLAVHDPLPEEKRDAVLLSPDLAPQLLAALDLQDCAVATVCRAWSVAWAARTRRVLRPAPPLSEPDFKLFWPTALAVLPGGERLVIADAYCVRIVDKQMRLQHKLGDEASGVTFDGDVRGLAAGDGGLYVAETEAEAEARVRRFQLDTFAVAAERLADADGYEYYGFSGLALAPGGPLFVVAERHVAHGEEAIDDDLLALDALTLEVRFKVGKDVLGGGVLHGLAVCGDEVFVGKEEDGSIRVLSLAGEPRRIIAADGWRTPGALCCVAERLYLIEVHEKGYGFDPEQDTEEQRDKRMAGRRVFVLTPEGATLRVCNSPKPLNEKLSWCAMCHFDSKLLVCSLQSRNAHVDEYGELLALQGL